MRLPRWFRTRRPSEAELARELRDHLALDAAEITAAGVDPTEARIVARRRFGNVGLIHEATREAWGSLWLERLNQDVRFGLRMLRRAPAFTAVAVSCLALGIGANAAVLSWTEGIVYHPFPVVRDQEALVAIAGTAKGAAELDGMSFPDFMDLSRGTTAFGAFFVSKITGATLTGGDRAERSIGQLVTANYFDALGVHPLLGRGFLPGEDVGRGAHPVTVISYRLWKDRFAGDPRIIGSAISYNGVPHTIVGVTPEAFLGNFVGYAMQFWIPVSQQAVVDEYRLEDRSARWVEGFARLRPGVTLAQGQAQVDAVAHRLETEFPNEDRGHGVRLFPLSENPFDNAKVLKPMLRVGALVAALVLVIVCANIANLLLVRAVSRRGEIIVRRALGAGRARLMRQLMTEGLILSLLGTASGLVVAYLSRHLLALFFAPRGGVSLVFAGDFNWRVVSTTIVVGLVSAVVFALVPAVQTTRVDMAGALRAATPGALGGGRARFRSVLILVQVGSSVVLLIGAGLMVTSVSRLFRANPGFDTANVTTTAVNLFAVGYDTARAHRFEDELLSRVSTIGGVSSAALSRSMPFAPRLFDNGPILVDGYQPSKDEQLRADYNQVTPLFFQTLGIPVELGRSFDAADTDTSARVAIVTAAMARRFWPSVSPIGKRLQLRGRWLRVVGVVGDIKYQSLTQAASMLFYVPLAQDRSTTANLFIRTARGAQRPRARAVVAAIHAIDPAVSPYEIITLREQVNRSTAGQQIMVTLLLTFGGVALLLAALGLYGVISYMVSQSSREIGLRAALGATPAQLIQLITASGLRLTALGVMLGVLVALGTTRLLGDLLFQVSPRDPSVITGVVLLLVLTSAVACLLPARRAARIDPVRALRM
jgi:macrolide transport system ATP-binding/permease protein